MQFFLKQARNFGQFYGQDKLFRYPTASIDYSFMVPLTFLRRNLMSRSVALLVLEICSKMYVSYVCSELYLPMFLLKPLQSSPPQRRTFLSIFLEPVKPHTSNLVQIKAHSIIFQKGGNNFLNNLIVKQKANLAHKITFGFATFISFCYLIFLFYIMIKVKFK